MYTEYVQEALLAAATSRLRVRERERSQSTWRTFTTRASDPTNWCSVDLSAVRHTLLHEHQHTHSHVHTHAHASTLTHRPALAVCVSVFVLVPLALSLSPKRPTSYTSLRLSPSVPASFSKPKGHAAERKQNTSTNAPESPRAWTKRSGRGRK